MDQRTRRRSALVATPIAAAFALAACGSGAPTAQGVCTDQRTGMRVDDRSCDRGGDGFDWVYIGGGYGGGRYPAVGQRVYTPRAGGGVGTLPQGVTATPPKGAEAIKGGAPVKGGPVARGIAGGGGPKGGSAGRGGGGTGG